jgi:hypothetical protein
MPDYQHYRPEAWFRDHLLHAFEALGPSVTTAAVHAWLRQHLTPMLSTRDFEKVNNGHSERWWHFVNWNRDRFRDEGLVHPGPRARTATGTYSSPYGQWELTEKGKQLIKARKSSRTSEHRAES